MVEKLKHYEEQCCVYHEHSINGLFLFSLIFLFEILFHIFLEFREMLESVERTSSSMAKLELDEQIQQAEQVLNQFKKQFDETIDKKLTEDNEEKTKHFDQLRPTFGHPARKNDLQEIDRQEKQRQNELQQTMAQLRTNTIVTKNTVFPHLSNLLFFVCLSRRISN
jgi:DNA polymerase III delta prime subunit